MSPRRATRTLGYHPALDGLRAVALIAVIAYHAGIDQMRGGFLGVSSFFTLSGFLITSLLLVERAESGRSDLASFWIRRVRRLLPAALVMIAATVIAATAFADDSQLDRLRADALASLFNFSNWRFIAESDSYAAIFQSPSVFRHFWSLAVEEQFYVVFPLMIAGALRLFGGINRGFGATVGLVGVLAIAWPAVLHDSGASPDRLYFGTDTRLGELMVGALLALWWVHRDRKVPDSPRVTTIVGLVSVAGLGWMWATANPDDAFLYRGGLALHSVATLAVIVAGLSSRGPIRAILSTEPLRRLGVVSYGAYLIHWPVLLWLQQGSTLAPGARFAVGMGLTIGLAAVMHHVVERPIRQAPMAVIRRRIWLAVPATAVVAAGVLVITAVRPPSTEPIDFAAAEAVVAELTSVAPDAGSSTADDSLVLTAHDARVQPDTQGRSTPSGGLVEGPVRLTGFGDSTALMTGLGLLDWSQHHPDQLTVVQGDAKLGCGLVTGAIRRVEGRVGPVSDECDNWLTDWVDALRGQRVDIAFIQLGAWEVFDHQVEPGGPFLAIGEDDEFDDLLRGLLTTAVDAVKEHSEVVAILANPDVGQARLESIPTGATYPELDPARSARWRELVEEVAAADDDTIVIDLAAWIEARDDDSRLRPDGVHFSADTTREVAEWLAPEILTRFRGIRDRAPDQRPAPAPRRVLLVGDSVMADTAPAALAALATSDEPVEATYELLPALPRTTDEVAEWRALVASVNPDVVVVYVGFWETLAAELSAPSVGEDPFEEVYRADVLSPWLDHLDDIGARTIILGMAPVRDAHWNDLIQTTMAAARAEAAGREQVDFVPTALALAPDGYADVLPDPRTGIPERVRRIDGLHLCPDGSERVVDLLLSQLAGHMELDLDDDWRRGSWRDETWDTEADMSVECPGPD